MSESRMPASHEDEDLRGTFLIVLIIAAIIIVVWASVFVLFLSRN